MEQDQLKLTIIVKYPRNGQTNTARLEQQFFDMMPGNYQFYKGQVMTIESRHNDLFGQMLAITMTVKD